MKLVTVIGARPQFIKASYLSELIKAHYGESITETIINTGQHYSPNMSDIFFKELNFPSSIINLNVAGRSHAAMTGEMMMKIEEEVLSIKPDMMLVYGDTNTTLAASLVASKLHIPLSHVEAGLRSFNKKMPEEINRVLTDHVSSLLFCPTDEAKTNLKKEGIVHGVHVVGDIMFDLFEKYKKNIPNAPGIVKQLKLEGSSYALVTCHRAENVDSPLIMSNILSALNQLSKDLPVIFPIHPRTEKNIGSEKKFNSYGGIHFIPPVSYTDMLALQKNAKIILTDSGGMQKEAYFFKKPCVTLRRETEWVETLREGWNRLAFGRVYDIYDAIINQLDFDIHSHQDNCFGNGSAAKQMIDVLLEKECRRNEKKAGMISCD